MMHAHHRIRDLLTRSLGFTLGLGLAGWALADEPPPEPPIPPEPPVALEPAPPPSYSSIWLQNPWTGDTRLARVPEPDQTLWNAARVEDYDLALAEGGAPALGVLTISSLGMQVPIYNGTDEFNLDRGLGRIKGMARMDEDGHLGISGHRDGFFRALKDLQEGDRIMVRSTTRVDVYEVDGFSIVDKHDTTILFEEHDKELTLVTCYPFYFVGNAPQRYIVHASPVTETN